MYPTDMSQNLEHMSVGVSDFIGEVKFSKFVCNVRSNLSDVGKNCENGLYISHLNTVSLKEYVVYRSEYCRRYHTSKCSECSNLVNMASHIDHEGILKVSEVYKRQFHESKYQSDKAIRRLMQLPVVILRNGYLFVTDLRPGIHYRTLIDWIKKTMPSTDTQKKLDKQTLKSLCELASTESDRKLTRSAATWDMSGRKAKQTYGIDDHTQKLTEVKEAIANYQKIQNEIMNLAYLDETALLRSIGVVADVESDTDSESLESGSDLESVLEGGSDNEADDSECEVKASVSEDTQVQESQENKQSLHVNGNIAPFKETLLLWLRESKFNWFSFYQDVTQYLKEYNLDVINEVLLNFAKYLPDSNLSEEEKKTCRRHATSIS